MVDDVRSRGGRSSRILDLLFLAALVLAAGQLVLLFVEYAALSRVVSGALALAGLAGCWWWVRPSGPAAASGRRLPTMAMMVLAACLPFVLDSSASWPMLLVAFMYFVPVWGVLAGATVVVLQCLAQFTLFVSMAAPPAEAILQSMATMMIFGCGLGAAWLVADHDRQRRAITELLAERERGFERESELMLVRERTRAARDLHDGLGHRLTLISMALQFAREARQVRPADAWEQVDHAQLQARDALDHMRRWVRALTPPAEPAGEPLAQIAATFAGAGMEIDLQMVGDEGRAGPELRLYERRFVQEGLTNALRHASGARVAVRRQIDRERLLIEVRDRPATGDPEVDGEFASLESSITEPRLVEEGFGLSNLRQRASSLGGSFVARRTGAGFMIIAELPLPADADSSAGAEILAAGR